MSSMLEQAIVDANALKEVAVKNAEQVIIEKYSADIKEAVSALLEQEEPMAAAAAERLVTLTFHLLLLQARMLVPVPMMRRQ